MSAFWAAGALISRALASAVSTFTFDCQPCAKPRPSGS